MRFVKGRLQLTGPFAGLTELQAQTDTQLIASDVRRLCPATGLSVEASWRAEGPRLQAVPILPEPFDVAVTRPVQKDGTLSFEGRTYSVPFILCGRAVEVRGCAGVVQVWHEGGVWAQHPRQTQKRLLVEPSHYDGPGDERVTAVAEIRKIPGVAAVVPRIVGPIELGVDRVRAVLVGVPLKDFPAGISCVQGCLYRGSNRNELVIGTELAQQLNLNVGDFLPPFYHNRNGERVSEVVGLFHSDVSLWQARLILTSFESAAHIFDHLKIGRIRGHSSFISRQTLKTTLNVPVSRTLLVRKIQPDPFSFFLPGAGG